jgi:hypothetical protein
MNTQAVQKAPQHDSASNMQLATTSETASTAVAAQAKALVEARYTVAIRRPRDIDAVRASLMKDCQRPSFAAVAIYNKPVGKGIKGPSIRFAEAALRAMTNITVETATMYDDREKRIVRVTVTDLEANLPYSLDVTIEKTIERRKVKEGDVVIRSRQNSYGDTVHLLEAGEDDILNKQNALISKAIRTQGLRLVPGDLIDEGMRICRETMTKEDAVDPDAAKRRLFDAFAELGVNIGDIKKFLGHDGAKLSPKEYADLRGYYAALKEGETTWREIMDSLATTDAPAAAATTTKTTKLRDAVKPAGSDHAQSGAPADAAPAFTVQEVHDAIANASSSADLNAAFALMKQLPEKDQENLHGLAITMAGKFAE